MDKVLIPLDVFCKMIEAIDDEDLRQQAYKAKENLNTSDLNWISVSLRDKAAHKATRYPSVANYLKSLATKIEKRPSRLHGNIVKKIKAFTYSRLYNILINVMREYLSKE